MLSTEIPAEILTSKRKTVIVGLDLEDLTALAHGLPIHLGKHHGLTEVDIVIVGGMDTLDIISGLKRVGLPVAGVMVVGCQDPTHDHGDDTGNKGHTC